MVEEVALKELESVFVPDAEESEEQAASESEEDEEKDELDVMKQRQYGSRKSARQRSQASVSGYMLNSSQIALTEQLNCFKIRSVREESFNPLLADTRQAAGTAVHSRPPLERCMIRPH